MPQFNVFLKSPNDAVLIETAAERFGLTRTEFARTAILNAAKIAVEASDDSTEPSPAAEESRP
jgi:hypothetical protein